MPTRSAPSATRCAEPEIPGECGLRARPALHVLPTSLCARLPRPRPVLLQAMTIRGPSYQADAGTLAIRVPFASACVWTAFTRRCHTAHRRSAWAAAREAEGVETRSGDDI